MLLSGDDIQSAAILTPYNGQVRELQRRFYGNKNLAAYEGMVDISSVDVYQVYMQLDVPADCFAGNVHLLCCVRTCWLALLHAWCSVVQSVSELQGGRCNLCIFLRG